MRYYLLLFIFSLSFTGLHSQKKAGLKRPKLVLFFFIDELNTTQLLAFQDKFSDKGFNRLMTEGVFLKNAQYPAGSLYKGTNLATLLSGSYPATHGIVSEKWYDRLRKSEVISTMGIVDYSLPDSLQPRENTSQILVSTIVDELKWMHNGASKVTTIGVEPSSFLWSGGQMPNEIYRLSKESGAFESLKDTTLVPLPKWVNNFNSKNLADLYSGREWGPSKDLNTYHQYKFFKDEVKGDHHFLYSLQKKRGKDAYKNVIESPYGNKLIRDFVAYSLFNSDIGRDDVTDVLSVHFSTKSTMFKNASVFAPETEDMVMRLDTEIGDILGIVEDRIGLNNTVVVLTSLSSPLRSENDYKRSNIPTGIFSGAKATSLLNLYLMAIHGQGKWVKSYNDSQIYLNQDFIKEKGKDFDEMAKQSAEFLMQMKGVAYAVPAKELASMNSSLSSIRSLELNFHNLRSGDILLRLSPGWNEEVDGVILSKQYSQVHLPLFIFGGGIEARVVNRSEPMINLAPTICTLLGIPFPNGCEGEVIEGF